MGYAMNSEFSRVLANEMKHYTESHDVDTISRVHGELDELKNIMVKNIGMLIIIAGKIYIFYLHFYCPDNVAMRGERLELLVNKTENLSNNVSTSCFVFLHLFLMFYAL